MKKEKKTMDATQVTDFVSKFQKEYPFIYISENITLGHVAGWLAQPHWKMYAENLNLGIIDQACYEIYAGYVC
jgi:hypothetical protein